MAHEGENMIDEILSGENAVDNSNQPTEQVEAEVAEGQENPQENNEAEGAVKKKRSTGYHRKITRLEQENASLRAAIEGIRPVEVVEEPQLDDFQDTNAYMKALARYEAAQVLAADRDKKKEEENKAKEREKLASISDSWEAKVEAAIDEYEDYDEVTEPLNNSRWRTDLAQAVRESEYGAQIHYYLAKNPELFNKLNSEAIGTYTIFKELSKLEGKFDNKPAAKVVSKSPAPIAPVKAGSKTVINLENLDTSSYIANRYPHLLKKK